jgi:uncharacterized protein (TIRG00374 family)
MVNKRLRIIARLGTSCLFGGYLAFKVDWTVVLYAFNQIALHLYATSTLLTLVSSFILACKYYLLIRDTSINRSILSLVKINLVSRFYALFLPSAVGPEAVRWYKITRNQRGRAFFLASTIFERLTFLLMLHLFALIPTFFYPSHSEIAFLRARILPAGIVSGSFLCLAMAYFVFPATQSFLKSIIARTLGTRWKFQNIDSFHQSFSLHNPTLSLYLYIFGLSLVWQMFFLCRLFLLFKAVDVPFGFIDIAWMGSLVLLLQVIPISFAGLGVREGAYAYLFTVFGLSPEKGVLVGILFFTQMLILAGIGGMFQLTEEGL